MPSADLRIIQGTIVSAQGAEGDVVVSCTNDMTGQGRRRCWHAGMHEKDTCWHARERQQKVLACWHARERHLFHFLLTHDLDTVLIGKHIVVALGTRASRSAFETPPPPFISESMFINNDRAARF